MRFFEMCAVLTVAVTSISYGQVKLPQRVEKGKEPSPRGTGIIIAELANVPRSLKALYDASTTIIDGVVETKLPSRQFNQQSTIETDFVISINQVIKGDRALRRLIVAELGGTIGPNQQILENDELMQPGQHYVLFLVPDNRAGLPSTQGIPHFSVVSAWVGKARVIGDEVRLNKTSPKELTNVYDGISLGQFKSEVQALGQQ